MIVVDASVLTESLINDGERGRIARAALGLDVDWLAPDHVAAELFSALRGRVLGGKLTATQAERALRRFRAFDLELVDTRGLFDRMWELRSNAPGYDAAYIAAAERNDCALVTTDRKLATIPGVRCEVRIAAP